MEYAFSERPDMELLSVLPDTLWAPASALNR
jgi:hypothetical protein